MANRAVLLAVVIALIMAVSPVWGNDADMPSSTTPPPGALTGPHAYHTAHAPDEEAADEGEYSPEEAPAAIDYRDVGGGKGEGPCQAANGGTTVINRTYYRNLRPGVSVGTFNSLARRVKDLEGTKTRPGVKQMREFYFDKKGNPIITREKIQQLENADNNMAAEIYGRLRVDKDGKPILDKHGRPIFDGGIYGKGGVNEKIDGVMKIDPKTGKPVLIKGKPVYVGGIIPTLQANTARDNAQSRRLDGHSVAIANQRSANFWQWIAIAVVVIAVVAKPIYHKIHP